jgi:trigger factor
MQEKVKVEELSKTKYKISINILPEEVDQKFNSFFESIKKQAEIPGFRKGKAPIERLKSLFLDKAKIPVAQSIIGEYYQIALSENSINPVGNPKIENFDGPSSIPGKFGFDNSYSVELVVETLPVFDPVGYMNLKLDFPQNSIESIFDYKMMKYREQFAERKQITDRGAKIGDSIVLDFKGFIDGIAFDGGAAQGHSIDKLGNANFIPGFEQQLEGLNINESKIISVKFPEKYPAEHLAGKEATFEVKIHSIVENKLAEIDNDLAMMVGFETIEELQNKTLEEAKKEQKLSLRQMLDGQIVSKLLESNNFDVPESMIIDELNRIIKIIQKQQKQNISQDTVDKLRQTAEFNVKRAVILDSIYNKENSLEVTPDELNNLLEYHAKANNKTKDEIVSMLYNTNQMDNFVGTLKIGKVLDFIIDNSNKAS